MREREKERARERERERELDRHEERGSRFIYIFIFHADRMFPNVLIREKRNYAHKKCEGKNELKQYFTIIFYHLTETNTNTLEMRGLLNNLLVRERMESRMRVLAVISSLLPSTNLRLFSECPPEKKNYSGAYLYSVVAQFSRASRLLCPPDPAHLLQMFVCCWNLEQSKKCNKEVVCVNLLFATDDMVLVFIS